MMPPPTAADDVSPLALRNDAARFTRNDVMFALCARRHTSLAKRHHARSAYHLPDRANIIEKSTCICEVLLRTVSKGRRCNPIGLHRFSFCGAGLRHIGRVVSYLFHSGDDLLFVGYGDDPGGAEVDRNRNMLFFVRTYNAIEHLDSLYQRVYERRRQFGDVGTLADRNKKDL